MTLFRKVLIAGQFRIRDADGERPWWSDPAPLGAMIRTLEDADLWLDFRYWRPSNERPDVELSSVEGLLETLPTWSEGTHTIASNPRGESRDGSYLELDLTRKDISPTLVVAGADLEARKATLLRAAEEVIVAWCEGLRAVADLTLMAGVTTYPVHATPARPPRTIAGWSTGAPLDVVSALAPEQARARGVEEMARGLAQALRTAVAPPAHRGERDGLVVFRWVEDLRDDESVVHALDARYHWLVGTLAAPPSPGWNEAGDQQVLLQEREPHSLLLAYDAPLRIGYLPIIATHQGDVDEETLANARAWARAGQLPDGTPLAELRLIVPVRAAAVALRPRARALGLPTVLYPSDDGRFWNPFPRVYEDDEG